MVEAGSVAIGTVEGCSIVRPNVKSVFCFTFQWFGGRRRDSIGRDRFLGLTSGHCQQPGAFQFGSFFCCFVFGAELCF